MCPQVPVTLKIVKWASNIDIVVGTIIQLVSIGEVPVALICIFNKDAIVIVVPSIQERISGSLGNSIGNHIDSSICRCIPIRWYILRVARTPWWWYSSPCKFVVSSNIAMKCTERWAITRDCHITVGGQTEASNQILNTTLWLVTFYCASISILPRGNQHVDCIIVWWQVASVDQTCNVVPSILDS